MAQKALDRQELHPYITAGGSQREPRLHLRGRRLGGARVHPRSSEGAVNHKVQPATARDAEGVVVLAWLLAEVLVVLPRKNGAHAQLERLLVRVDNQAARVKQRLRG